MATMTGPWGSEAVMDHTQPDSTQQRDRAAAATSRRVMCLHFPCLATDRARIELARAGRRLDGDEPLVLTRRAGKQELIAHVDPRARRLGLSGGLTVAQGQARSSRLVALEHDAAGDRVWLHRLAQWALRFSPVVEPVEPDVVLVDITGCQRLFKGEHNLARQAQRGAEALGLAVKVAVADTVGAAWALAVAGESTPLISGPGELSAYLAPLPVWALRLEPATVEQLEAVGVRSIGDLLMLPRSCLPGRFGPALVRRLRQALGEVYEELDAASFTQPPSAARAWEVPLVETAPAVQILGHLLAGLFAELHQRHLAVRRLDVLLTFEAGQTYNLAVGFSRALHDLQYVEPIVRGRFENVDLSRGLVGLRLIAGQTAPLAAAQMELFEPPAPGQQEDFARLLDRLVNRLGARRVLLAELVEDHQPECSFRLTCAADVLWGRQHRRGESALYGENLPPRPLRLLPRPLPLQAECPAADEPPTRIWFWGHWHCTARTWGPERIETGWWRGVDVRRDYYRLCTTSGSHLWIFRDLETGGWYLHGLFE